MSVWLLRPFVIDIHVLNANNVDLDQMPRSESTLLITLLRDARHKCVKLYFMAVGIEPFFNRKHNPAGT